MIFPLSGSPGQLLCGANLEHFQLSVVSSGFVTICHLLGLCKESNWAVLKLH